MRAALLVTALFAVVTAVLLGALPLWLDEILQLIESRDPSVSQMIERLPRNSGAAPLGYLTQHYSLELTGYGVRRSRVPAALFGVATVCAVALLAATLGVRYYWLAALLFAVFPQTLRYATESRVYSQALFFSVLSTLVYVALEKRNSPAFAALYWLVLTLAVYTHPYAIFVGLAHLLWSAARRELRSLLYGGIAFAAAAAAFLPWYLWSKERWSIGIAHEGFRFSFSGKILLMVFREIAGAGYWGSALLLILCALALTKRRLRARAGLLLLVVFLPLVCVFAADATEGYFVAARQFLWIVPPIAILAAMAIEAHPRSAMILYALLGIVGAHQGFRYFTAPRENWEAAADFLSSRTHGGACLMVAPPEHARFYEFFHPELAHAHCRGLQMVVAITPATTHEQGESAIASLVAQGYREQNEAVVGRSRLVFFRDSTAPVASARGQRGIPPVR